MKKVFKYEVDIFAKDVMMPKGAKILSAGYQPNSENIISVWAEVDTENELESRCISVFCTGEEIPYSTSVIFEFIGTVFLPHGIVLHVYIQSQAL